MGDLFRREAAASPEPFTGERLTGAIGGQVQIEHYHRYLFARSFCRGLDVLDVASGEGYGSAQLAQVARSVIGVEFDPETVRSAARAFVRPNLRYLQGDARALPLADGCVDAIVSFETIEHFDRQETFIAEAYRVLRPDGLFIVSTPDRDIYSGPNTPPNAFHVKELTAQEFVTLLQARFRNVALLRQRPVIGSTLLADAGPKGAPLIFDRRGESQFEVCDGLPRAPYLVAVASDGLLPSLPVSLYIERSDLDTTSHALQEQSRALASSEQALARIQAVLTDASGTIEHLQLREAALQTALQESRAALQQAHAVLIETRTELEAAHAALREAEGRAASVRERAAAAEEACALSALETEAVRHELDMLRGSARTFLRSYLPRLRRHVLMRGRGPENPPGC
jgi:SAM-dependent methyltransferase